MKKYGLQYISKDKYKLREFEYVQEEVTEIEQKIGISSSIKYELIVQYLSNYFYMMDIEEKSAIRFYSMQEQNVYQQNVRVVHEIKTETRMNFSSQEVKVRYETHLKKVELVQQKYRIDYNGVLITILNKIKQKIMLEFRSMIP